MKTLLLATLAALMLGCSARAEDVAPPGHTVTVSSVAADSGLVPTGVGAQLLEQAKAANPGRYQFAVDVGATISATSDGESFSVSWFPPGTEGNRPPVIATIHGHGSWAFDEFFLWYPYAAERGYGIVALQWWDGEGERFQDYYDPREVNRELSLLLRREGVEPGTVMFHGFSRGSANSYATVAYDATGGEGYFALAIANSGKPGLDFPPNVEIERGRLGPQPLAGTTWVTFCGALDPNPERDGCGGMRAAAEWIEGFGGVLVQAIEDPVAAHGGFHRSPANVNAALDAFAAVLESNQ